MRFGSAVLVLLLAVSALFAGTTGYTTDAVDEVTVTGSMFSCWDSINDIEAVKVGLNRYLVIAAGRSGVLLFRASSTEPTFLSKIDGIGDVQGVCAYQNEETDDLVIFAMSGEDGVYVIDGSSSSELVVANQYNTDGFAYDAVKQQHIYDDLYVADGEGGLVALRFDENSFEFTLHSIYTGATGPVVQVVYASEYVWFAAENDGLYALDMEDPRDPILRDSMNISNISDISMQVRDIFVANGENLFLTYINPGTGEIYSGDVVDLDSPIHSMLGAPDLNHIYVGAEDGLHIIDATDEQDMVHLGTLPAPSHGAQMAINDFDHIYSISPEGISFIEARTTPATPTVTPLYNPMGGVVAMDRMGTLLATANKWDGVYLTDISDAEAPADLSEVSVYGAMDVQLIGGRLYTFTLDSLFIHNVTTPSQPTFVTSLATGMVGSEINVAINDQRLVVERYTSLDVYDMADLDNPSLLYQVDVPSGANYGFGWVQLRGTDLYTSETIENNATYRYYKFDLSGTTEASLEGQFDVNAPEGDYAPMDVRVRVRDNIMTAMEQSPMGMPTGKLVIRDITDFSSPVELGSIDIDNHGTSFLVQQENLVATGGIDYWGTVSGLTVLDVVDPANITVVATDPELLVTDAEFYGEQLLTADLSQVDLWDISADLDVETVLTTQPSGYALAKVYPNPFNAMTTAVVTLPATSELNVALYNMLGQKVADLVQGTVSAGAHRFVIDGKGLASGMYVVRATVPGKLNQATPVYLLK